ncbi:Ser/Thr protein kinase RdoA involved in Cpx stress response, MazF antagonist [Sanguibacter gelidistatuariae]|uniref:Ser/Thr protein kinase RdoA involved in Cpx stress response, MazF antagonist n=1 Tax=Sanguibacter gelidistatuariae TaxID=1814289 RepID=A0A1G6H4Q7_9MICO|nr:aminoglycoside phosphotransferase family protein [Sanguibacter gelidistatuariae]SDB89262.1 Ser/Thr protein kinase RdoA involved in Cpx stress response, MazF antagonist [Sanguibacter gelidistatuariae]
MSNPADSADRVRRIMALHGLPASPTAASPIPGVENEVTMVGPSRDRYVVRWPRDLAGGDFTAEIWAADRARACGVPTPEVVAAGILDKVSYSVHRYVEGRDGGSVRSPDLWRTVGGYAAAIATVPLDAAAPDSLFSRFGRDLRAAWQAHLAYNLDALDDSDPLVALGVYTRSEQSRIRSAVEELVREPQGSPLRHGLLHGDLALRNVVVPDDGPPVLIDWGSATTGPVPYTDLLHLLRARETDGAPDDAELEAFADGYGVNLTAIRPQLESLRLLAAVDLVRWARDRRPDRLEATIAAVRARLRRR